MSEALSHLFKGPFAALGETLAITPVPRIPLGIFLSDGGLRETLTRFSRRWSDPDPRAVVTQWSKTYFSTLLPAALLPVLMHDWQLPLSVDNVGLQLSADGAVRGFDLLSAGSPRKAGEDKSGRFDFLVEGHLRPVIEAMAATTSLPRKVLWSNAGNVFENVLGRASGLLGNHHPAVQEAMSIMANRLASDGRANPLFEPVRYVVKGGEHVRQRKICCLRYFTPDLGYCKSCPKPENDRSRN